MWTYGLPWGFRKLGHEVRIVKAVKKDFLPEVMKTFKPDLLVTVGWIYEYMKPWKREIIRKTARKYGCVHAYWATEDITWFERWSLPLVKEIQPDVVFTINAECISSYQKLGIPAFPLDFGYNSEFEGVLQKPKLPQYTWDLALVANSYQIWDKPQNFRYKSAKILMQPLIQKNYKFVIYGTGWEQAPWFKKAAPQVHFLGELPFADAFPVYRSAKIILNPQNEGRYKTQVTSRTFEIMGSGGFQLTIRTPAVARLFKDRQHLVMSRSPEETLRLVDYYLTEEKERLKIAACGQAEVLKKHTYDQRAAYLLNCLASLNLLKKA